MTVDKGHCKHGEFILADGCQQCVNENLAAQVKAKLEEGLNSEGLTLKVETDTSEVVVSEPGTDIEVWGYYKEALKLQHYAESRVIATVEDTKSATDDLSVIAKLKKAMEEKRKEYVVPLQTQVKQINDTYKSLMEPIESADRVTRSKILDYRKAQERIRQEQEEVNRLRMEAARREMELKGELTESVDLVEVVPEVSKSVTTDMGAASTFKVRKWEIVDFTLVPNDLKLIDAGKVTKLVKAGIGSISGIRIWEEDSLRVTPR